jgi:undecaprenyl-diphosphatase
MRGAEEGITSGPHRRVAIARVGAAAGEYGVEMLPGRRPWTVALATAAAGYVAVVAALTAAGLLFTTFLLDGPLGDADERAVQWFADHRTATLNGTTLALSRSADTLGAIAIALIVATCFALRRHWSALAALVTGLVLELLAFLAVNALVGRPRPDVEPLGSVPTTSSFPSGHTAATLVIYTCVALAASKWCRRMWVKAVAWGAAVVMPIAVAFARVYRGMHHPFDVVAGLVLGLGALTVALATVHAANEARCRERVAADAEPARLSTNEAVPA